MITLMKRIFCSIECRIRHLQNRIWWHAHKHLFGSYGSDIRISKGDFSFRNIFLGNDILIGPDARFWAVHSTITIRNKVIFGPEVIIMAGDHNIRRLGKFMSDVGDKEKEPENDQDVLIEEDTWIGTRAIILKGVKISRGCVIGAGALVNRSVPPYSIAVGNPAKPVGMRWNVDQIMEHEKQLYPEQERLPRHLLENVYKTIYSDSSHITRSEKYQNETAHPDCMS